jgi:hypothetical protein
MSLVDNTKKVPRGIRNNNPLNIVKGQNWKGERHPQTDRRFEEFESMQYGIRAGFKLLRNYITGFNGIAPKINNIDSIIKRWAPSHENNTESYITQVCQRTGLNRYQRISFGDRKKMVDIVAAMIFVENGQEVERDIIESGYDLL